MGLYPVDCPQCKKAFMWFSGNAGDPRCDACRNPQTTSARAEQMRLPQRLLKQQFMKKFRLEMKEKKTGQDIFEIVCNVLCNTLDDEQAASMTSMLKAWNKRTPKGP